MAVISGVTGDRWCPCSVFLLTIKLTLNKPVSCGELDP